MMVTGLPASDVAMHFVKRWNQHQRDNSVYVDANQRTIDKLYAFMATNAKYKSRLKEGGAMAYAQAPCRMPHALHLMD